MFARWFYGDQASPARLSSTPTMGSIESTHSSNNQHNLNRIEHHLLTGPITDGIIDHKMPLTEESMQQEEALSLDVVDETDSPHLCEAEQEQPVVATGEPVPPTINRLRVRAATISGEDIHSNTLSAMSSFPARPRSYTTLSPGVSFHPPLTHTIPRLKPRDEHSSCYHCGNHFSFFRRKVS
jgi:hypothetical protein